MDIIMSVAHFVVDEKNKTGHIVLANGKRSAEICSKENALLFLKALTEKEVPEAERTELQRQILSAPIANDARDITMAVIHAAQVANRKLVGDLLKKL